MPSEIVVRIMILIGCIILSLLCWNDFKENIVKPKTSQLRYYFALMLFEFINLFIYLFLCFVFMGVEPFIIGSSASSTIRNLDLMHPILIAFMYFGAGAARFSFGNIEINFYKKMLEILQSIFCMSFKTINTIRESIENTRIQCQTLECKIRNLHDIGNQKGWDILKDKWKNLNEDNDMLNKQIEELNSLYNELDTNSITKEHIERIKNDLLKKIEYIRTKITHKLKSYLFELIIKNIKDEKDIENSLKDLDIFLPETPIPQIPNITWRCGVICFTFGILFGPILSPTRSIAFSGIGALTFGIFGIFISQIRKFKEGFKNLTNVLLFGALAGATAFFVWELFGSIPQDLKGWGDLLRKLIIGIAFGVGIAVFLYIYRIYIKNLFNSAGMRYLFVIISGFVLFNILFLMFFRANVQDFGIKEISRFMRLGVLGSVVMLAIALGMRVFSTD